MLEEVKLKIDIRSLNDVECMYLQGFLDAHTAPVLENAIQEAMGKDRFKILMNFNKLDYISSAGLGVFMSFIEEIRNNGGDIKMSNMNEKVFSVFDLLGFPMLFDIHPDEFTMIEKFSIKEIE